MATFYPFILKLLYQREETNELDEEVLKKITAAEQKLMEFINKMKVEADVENGKEKVA